MHRFSRLCQLTLLSMAVIAIQCPATMAQDSDYSSINIRHVNDGLVVIATKNMLSQDDITFGCDQESNAIIVDLPVENERPIVEKLIRTPYVNDGGVTVSDLSDQIKRFTIHPTLKLYCSELKLVSKFQRYVSYHYPAGRDIRIISAEANGFDFDDLKPTSQVKGSISLKLAKTVGDMDLTKSLTVVDNRLSLRLNPRDFVNQDLLTNLFPTKDLSVKSSRLEYTGEQTLEFRTIQGADIGKVAARLNKSASGDELRLDITLTVALSSSGKRFYENGDSKRALRYLDAARREPGLALVALMSMGTIYWNDDNLTEASNKFIELIGIDRTWEFPDARYYAAKSYYLLNNRLSFELSNRLKEFLRRCDRTSYATCENARELFDQVNEPELKLNSISKAELRKLSARLADPKLNFYEVQKNIFHYWATWCPVCLQEIPRIMKYAVAHPNISIYIVAKYDNQKAILNTLIKSGAIKRKNIFYYVDSKDDMLLRQMVPLILANKSPVTPLPISVFLQRENPFYITDSLEWNDTELAQIWRLKYRE